MVTLAKECQDAANKSKKEQDAAEERIYASIGRRIRSIFNRTYKPLLLAAARDGKKELVIVIPWDAAPELGARDFVPGVASYSTAHHLTVLLKKEGFKVFSSELPKTHFVLNVHW